jgi:hypothetical protein
MGRKAGVNRSFICETDPIIARCEKLGLIGSMRLAILLKKSAIFCHRWMGLTFCLLFA